MYITSGYDRCGPDAVVETQAPVLLFDIVTIRVSEHFKGATFSAGA